ncbi:hypothetical protein FC65_GL000891 [Ligilactobacillus acidipiscis DSM 15836]|uniref:Uncharacterized protein n=1 Tax=Ligilactobacillus acidipiscis DSM 15836 TaxID=1423716 RepID=A0ABR5PNE4_9LACO|nr:hypothetical protein [Ligilactobacillus acidipiscis]KRM31978.1 hypothetical protein FC65_GL000891 [Ligilactobacillus acidipiscis DSM 15836]GAW63100.1 hypothetical protein Lacidipiscis_00282 [Ligilactobacillus acidipiscis]GEN19695.1 hypothetical protein LAC02_29760 [Ligilactobacillus acidipiscis]
MMPQEKQNNEMIDKLIEQQLNNAVIIKKVREANKNDLQQVKSKMTADFKDEISRAVKSTEEEMHAFVDDAIEDVKKTIPLNDGEATNLKSIISQRANITTLEWIGQTFGDKNYGGSNFYSKKYGHIIGAFYSIVKKHFNAIKYTTILHANYEDAINYAKQLNIYDLPERTLRITEAQLQTLNVWEISHGYKATEPKD